MTWVPTFLRAIEYGATVQDAAISAGVDPSTAHKRRREDPEFRRAWAEVGVIGTQAMEREAARRAYHGVEEPVFHKGEVCGSIRKYSDTLMIFLLKARRPEVYRDMVEQGKGATNVAIQANVAAADLVRELIRHGALGDVVEGTPPITDIADGPCSGQLLSLTGEIPAGPANTGETAIVDNSDSSMVDISDSKQ